MGKNTNQTYQEGKSVGTSGGDPLAGVPIDRHIVESAATEYGLENDVLARALREVEQTPELLSIEVFFAKSDSTILGTDEAGHLYLLANAEAFWDVVADRLGLTPEGREAVATAHDSHVHEHVRCHDLGDGVGFVIACPKFPPEVIPDIHAVLSRTPLTGRQAAIWALDHYALSVAAIAKILGISDGLVEWELAAVDKETRQLAESVQILDTPGRGITRLRPDPSSDRWLGLDWSSWMDLQERKKLLERLSDSPGVYRVRHTGLSGLLYIGESKTIRNRLGHGLAVGLGEGSPPQEGSHGATKPLWRILNAIEGSVEVSVATPPLAANKRHRLCLEAALVAVHRRETGRTPDVMLNRDPLKKMDHVLDGLSEELSTLPNDESSPVPNWRTWKTVTSPDWMGFDWSTPRPLADRGEITNTDTCIFRVWEKQQDGHQWSQVLTSIESSDTPISRLYSLEERFGSDTIFSVFEPDFLSTGKIARNRDIEEVRYDLLGTHYLATGVPPVDQF
jgi:hypothetical protein